MKKYSFSFLFIFIGIFLLSCGGGGKSKNSNSNNTRNNTSNRVGVVIPNSGSSGGPVSEVYELEVATTRNAFAVLNKTKGTIECYNNNSELNWGKYCSDIETLTKVEHIFSNQTMFAALKKGGSVATWGCDLYEDEEGTKLPCSYTNDDEENLKSGVKKIFSNEYAFAALKDDGKVVTWGVSANGGDSSSVQEDLVNVVKIYPNASNMGGAFAALRKDKRVVSWGNSMAGGDYTEELKEKLVNIVEIYSNKFAYAAITEDRHVVTWGYDSEGGNSDAVQEDLHDVVEITPMGALYEGAFAARTSEGNVVTWGNAWYGGDASNSDTGVIAASEPLTNIIKVFSTNGAFAAIKGTTLESDSGSVVTWGSSDSGGDSSSVSTSLSSGVTNIFSNNRAFAALKSNGDLVTWGASSGGGTPGESVTNVSKIFSIGSAFAALKKNGSVFAWGTYGPGSNIYYDDVKNDLLSGVIDISSTKYAVAALKSDGSVVSWGGSEYGGDSSDIKYYTGSNKIEKIVNIYSGPSFFVGVRADGTYIAWGTI